MIRGLKPNPHRVHFIEEDSWIQLEDEQGFKFPTEYKDFIKEYGTYCIGDFIWILNPFEENINLNLRLKSKEMLEAMIVMKTQLPDNQYLVPYNGDEGLFPFAITENGDEIYWNVRSNSIDEELVIIESRSYNIEIIDCSFDKFINGLLDGTIKISFFPDDIEY